MKLYDDIKVNRQNKTNNKGTVSLPASVRGLQELPAI